ncbi:hypothetical protein PVAND_007795 [Polypedilum vanderplanki]|uniref:Alpha-amylase n=1 Tax=Polypedilum vanderplanki TaxID=319348 RepID=A0A9J6C826_POLVA|nr:hypothetical protein PVAND_007795 [Polypedilum vanderplanki]
MKVFLVFLSIVLTITFSSAQWDPHYASNRNVMVHLFEWKWKDIAEECETFLAPNGFAGVQVSPPTENTAIHLDWLSTIRPWWERYQPISYKLETRSGNEAAFADMVRRCNAVGVRIYVDILLNHMSATNGTGTGGSSGTVSTTYLNFPSVPFTTEDFNPYCSLDWNSQQSIRNCWLVGLPDLNQKRAHVRDMQINLLNHLIDLGVAGFRVDAAKHMWAEDLEYIFSRMHNLNTNHGFHANSRPFVVQEVIVGDGIYMDHYTHLGAVTVFEASRIMGQVLRGHADINDLRYFSSRFGIESKEALIFVDNHDNQRDGGLPLTNHREPRIYKIATAYNLAQDFGHQRIMSSFYFSHRDQGPPQDASQNILSPTFDANGQCTNGWVCEHRWPAIRNMVQFSAAVKGTKAENWWTGWNEIAFSRGNRGFIAINAKDNGDSTNVRLYTSLPAGIYCDMSSGNKVGNSCTRKTVTVGSDGYADIYIPGAYSNEEGFIAIHVDAKL